mmetsp:Transcript_16259/g.48518  ORF Transcript_16259/g.48518 Transcript_16259/m.48518 type:complete len:147 (+) Transcript_16259:140-580(+)|eukprot:CAMPEP_0119259460 /NCGR_PEP_ID=MMETSP1329-20130426/275_1 /TAXON_ID=114041 /ORGANISM="Genus nov. species nov., Strain RCC1024" /LENGTH=146 /DNA_ID=CAMNT_0007258845 /DNA_START=132 /DNA_END=572 /DNA_ORIENTATION=+
MSKLALLALALPSLAVKDDKDWKYDCTAAIFEGGVVSCNTCKTIDAAPSEKLCFDSVGTDGRPAWKACPCACAEIYANPPGCDKPDKPSCDGSDKDDKKWRWKGKKCKKVAKMGKCKKKGKNKKTGVKSKGTKSCCKSCSGSSSSD